jgi:ribosomal protein S18 acetylase RimI-like enzyme
VNTGLQVRRLVIDDIPAIVRVHMSAFSGFFLTTLGEAFLEKYYKAVIIDSNSVCIGCKDEQGHLLGFAVGSRLSRGFHLGLLGRHWAMFFLEGLRLLLRRPKAVLRLGRNLSKNGKPGDDGLYAELLSIGVLPSSKGKGVGSSLMEEFERAAASSGATKVALTTDKVDNEAGLAFYSKNGYQIFYEFITYPDRKMYKLLKNLA